MAAGTATLNRRQFLGGSTAAVALAVAGRRARAAPPGDPEGAVSSTSLTAHELTLDGDHRLARKAVVFEPPRDPGEVLPVLVFLHGLGETKSERLGLTAWGEKYGLVRADERLRTPPVGRDMPRSGYFSDQRLNEINASLARRPHRGVLLVCPFTPNFYDFNPTAAALDRYAEWIEHQLLPTVRGRFGAASSPALTAIDGCSLGGYASLEVFLRKPELFGSVGGVQAAIGAARASSYAERLAHVRERVGPRRVHLLTSSRDPFRKANEELSRGLAERGVPHVLDVPPGPHDQPWLREVGTLTMLHFHERTLRA